MEKYSMTGLDEKDGLILRELERDAGRTTKQLARKLGLPPTTVHNRVSRLEKLGERGLFRGREEV